MQVMRGLSDDFKKKIWQSKQNLFKMQALLKWNPVQKTTLKQQRQSRIKHSKKQLQKKNCKNLYL